MVGTFFNSSFRTKFQYYFSEVDYPPQLQDEGLKSVIWETNKTIRTLNAKLGLQSPKVFLCFSLLYILKQYFKPGKALTKLDHGKLRPKAGAWARDGYHVSYDGTAPYEQAMVDYLLGT